MFMRDFLIERNLLTAAKPNLQRHHLNPPTAAHTKRTALEIFSIQISLLFWEALDRQVREGRTAPPPPTFLLREICDPGGSPRVGGGEAKCRAPRNSLGRTDFLVSFGGAA